MGCGAQEDQWGDGPIERSKGGELENAYKEETPFVS